MPAAVLAEQRRQRLGNNASGLANCLRGVGSGAQPSLWRELPALQLPALLIVGAEDAKFRRINREMAAQIPGAQLAIIPAAGHITHLENPRAFERALRSFLQHP